LFKIIKPEKVHKLNEVVIIPDLPSIETDFDEENADNEESSEVKKLSREIYNKVIDKAKADAEVEREKILRMTNEERQSILNNTQSEVIHIKRNAQKEAENIINHAKEEYNRILEEARQEGLKKGIEEKSEAVEKLIKNIEGTLEEMKELQIQYMQEYAKEIKGLSLQIAEKVIGHKMDENDLFLMDTIKTVLKNVRDAKWITVEISDKLPKLVEMVIEEMTTSGNNPKIEVQTIKDADKGTCIIQLSDRVIDASIATQLKNIEEYFKEDDEAVYAK
jgi:flagellar assembly protein FliH